MTGVLTSLLKNAEESITTSADWVARAAEEKARRDGLLENPGTYIGRAALLREHLRAAHDAVGAEEAATILKLAQEVLGGVWGTLWEDVAAADVGAAAHVGQNQQTWTDTIEQGRSWVWGAFGRSLGVPCPELD